MLWALRKKSPGIIRQAQGDYIRSLKANHPTLFQDVDNWFKSLQVENSLPLPAEHITEAGHHRIEIRKYWTFSLEQLPALHESAQWTGLKTIAVVERIRHLRTKTTHEIQYYLSSLPSNSSNIARAIRSSLGQRKFLALGARCYCERRCVPSSLPSCPS